MRSSFVLADHPFRWWLIAIAVFTNLGIAPRALAREFDLDCSLVQPDGSISFGKEPMRFQISLSQGRWCNLTCNSSDGNVVGQAVEVAPGSIMLRKVSSIGSVTEVQYDEKSGEMINSFEPSTPFELKHSYRCTKAVFGGLNRYLTAPPKPRRSMLLGSGDFLRDEKKRPIGGNVGVSILVLADGTVGDCAIAITSGNALLDQHSCRLVEERMTEFKPALDHTGKAVAGTFKTMVRWMWAP